MIANNPFGTQPVVRLFLMFAQRAGNFLHGFEAAAQEMFAPYIQETCHLTGIMHEELGSESRICYKHVD